MVFTASVASVAQERAEKQAGDINYTWLSDGYYVDGLDETVQGTSLVIPDKWNGNKVVGILAINNNNITSVSFAGTDGLKISLKAFGGNKALKTVGFKVGGLIIDDLKDYETHTNPFLGCTSLESVNGETVVCLDKKEIISYCVASPATTITIDKNKYGTTVGESAFEGARNLQVINLPDANHVKARAFKDCTSLTEVNMPQVRQLYPGTFQGCTSLKSFVLPDDMTILQGETFDGCMSLESVTFPTPFHSIAYRAFRGCTSLKSLTLPKEIATIYVQAFKDCTGLTDIVLPAELEEFGPEVFTGCTALRSVTAPMPEPFEANENVFDTATYQTATLYVPRGKRSAYASTLPWSNFRNIVEKDL